MRDLHNINVKIVKDMKINRKGKIMLSILFVVAILSCSVMIACAEEKDDRTCSITLELQDAGMMKENQRFQVYRIGEAEMEGELRYRLMNVYQYLGVDLNQLYLAGQQREAARRFRSALSLSTLIREGCTDQDGKLCFGGLSPGVYLVTLSGYPSDIEIEPFLVFLPHYIAGDWEYHPRITPKVSYHTEKTANGKRDEVAKTGDRRGVQLYLIMLSGSLIAAAGVMMKRGWERWEKRNGD